MGVVKNISQKAAVLAVEWAIMAALLYGTWAAAMAAIPAFSAGLSYGSAALFVLPALAIRHIAMWLLERA